MRCGATPSDSREDYVEEAWRIVDPAIQASTPIHEYEPGTWGPKEAERMVPGGWYVATSLRSPGNPPTQLTERGHT